MSSADKIERHIVLRAPQSRVWQAITDARQFGEWFRVALEGPFVVGAWVAGRITYPGYEHVRFKAFVDAMLPEHRFAFRWHPHAIDPAVDYSHEPTTLVVFELETIAEGTRVSVVESGFDGLPPSRREIALRANADGWTAQLDNVKRHVEV